MMSFLKLGEPSDNIAITGFGSKFIGVGSGGTLEFHGLPKVGWTKITEKLAPLPTEAYRFTDVVNTSLPLYMGACTCTLPGTCFMGFRESPLDLNVKLVSNIFFFNYFKKLY